MKISLHNKSFEPFTDENFIAYDGAYIFESEFGPNCIIGSNSCIYDSILGNNVRVERNVCITSARIGAYTIIDMFSRLRTCDIGRFSSIAHGVSLGGGAHPYKSISSHLFMNHEYAKFYNILNEEDLTHYEGIDKSLIIGNDVWIAGKATVLRGLTIGDGAIVGANALVNKDVPPYAIVAGVPARIIKYRFSQEVIDELLKIQWWNWPIEKIRANAKLFTAKELTLEMLKDIKEGRKEGRKEGAELMTLK